MFKNNKFTRVFRTLSGLSLIFGLVSFTWADQVTLSYVDIHGDAQVLSVDAASPDGDHAKMAPIIGENGAALTLDKTLGQGSVVEIAEAMATAAPLYAADIAQALATLSPEDANDIAIAVNSVSGVDTNAVLAAVHFGPPIRIVVPPVELSLGADNGALPVIERVPSSN